MTTDEVRAVRWNAYEAALREASHRRTLATADTDRRYADRRMRARALYDNLLTEAKAIRAAERHGIASRFEGDLTLAYQHRENG